MKHSSPAAPAHSAQATPDLARLFLAFLAVGTQAFGAATADVVIRNIIERRGWLAMDDLGEALAQSALLPGPFHINLIMNLGWRLAGLPGQLIALAAFTLPSFLLACLVAALIGTPIFVGVLGAHDGLRTGMVAAVCALVLDAALRLSRGLSVPWWAWPVLVGASLILFHFRIPLVLVILGSGFAAAAGQLLRVGRPAPP